MCTALNLKNKQSILFGRNLDIEISYGQQVVITPRNFEWPMRCMPGKMKQNYAMVGMALPFQDPENGNCSYPLYFEAANEKGLGCAGLNFPGIAYYPEPGTTKATKGKLIEITPYEVIQWVLANFKSVKEVKEFFANNTVVFVNKAIAPQFPVAPLHFIVSDKEDSFVLEPCKDGLKTYDNPVGILTNNPPFDWQMYNLSMYQNLLSEQSYDVKWGNYNLKPFGQGFGAVGLPGDCTPPSRFVRAVFNKYNSNCGETTEDLITQYFHVMDSIAMVKGTIIVRNQQKKDIVHDDITLYTSCIDLNTGIYYYKTYGNNRISVVNMMSENLDGKDIIIYPFIEKQDFNYLNKK